MKAAIFYTLWWFILKIILKNSCCTPIIYLSAANPDYFEDADYVEYDEIESSDKENPPSVTPPNNFTGHHLVRAASISNPHHKTEKGNAAPIQILLKELKAANEKVDVVEKMLADMTQKFEDKNNSTEKTKSLTATAKCGGVIELDGAHDLVYSTKGSNTLDNQVTCIWLIKSAKNVSTSKISITLPKSDLNKYVLSKSSRLVALNSPSGSHPFQNSSFKTLKPCDCLWTFPGPFFILQFHSFPSAHSQGFHAVLKEVGHPHVTVPNPDVRLMTNFDTGLSPRHLVYPTEPSMYWNNDRLLIWLRSYPGQKLQVSVDYLQTEKKYDTLQIFRFLKLTGNLQVDYHLSGGDGIVTNTTAVMAAENEPVLIYFYSDVSNMGSGFKISYFYTAV